MIVRAPKEAATHRYDLAVIGGGIHGACIALEATRRGLKVVLLEARDFGSGATGNSLRILHGGLRYLQTMDLPRFRESVAERRWFARVFPDLVAPLPCLMPLYGNGLKRRSVMRAVLAVNDLLAHDRNNGVAARATLPRSGTFGVGETEQRFAAVRREGLEGSALWYDYQMRSSERVLIEILRWACALGARALNYTEVREVRLQAGEVRGLQIEDRLTGEQFDIVAERVCNCTGSLARAFAARHDRDLAQLFVPSLAFNVLFDCERLSENALAVAAPEPGAPVYFLCPASFGLWAGTEHVGRPDGCIDSTVTEAELLAFIGRINRAIPTLGLSLASIRRVFSGLLPVRTAMQTDLTAREAIVDHGSRGGPKNLFSVTGIKFTTAREVGQKAMDAMIGTAPARKNEGERPKISWATKWLTDAEQAAAIPSEEAESMIRAVAAEEASSSAEDFFLRRTNWIFTARQPARPVEALNKIWG